MIIYEEYKDELRQALRDVLCAYPKGEVEAYIDRYIEGNEQDDALKKLFEHMMDKYGEERTLTRIGSFAADVYMCYPDL